ncbi:mitochondrial carrier domain-containing protein [Xylariaceae sp. FL0804]|nr:mitochondrial carrier domain-containing protein [Xylariaceae sp. FL0804]
MTEPIITTTLPPPPSTPAPPPTQQQQQQQHPPQPRRPSPSPSPSPSYATALLAGGLAGTAVDLTLFPLDTLKTRLQAAAAAGGRTTGTGTGTGRGASSGSSSSLLHRYRGLFRGGLYSGVGSIALGSAPGAALFFCGYEGVKARLRRQRQQQDAHATYIDGHDDGRGTGDKKRRRTSGGNDDKADNNDNVTASRAALEHMAAASVGEVLACAVRVPTEVVKQRAQAGQHGGRSAAALTAILFSPSSTSSSSSSSSSRRPLSSSSFSKFSSLPRVWRELYRGWGITVLRELPFAWVQFSLWEALKAWSASRKSSGKLPQGQQQQQQQGQQQVSVGAAESALYGSASGAVAAALTTPLDVLKTRVMLARSSSSPRSESGNGGGRVSVLAEARALLREGRERGSSLRPFFAGVGPRVVWISVGGAIFLGSYQFAVNALQGSGQSQSLLFRNNTSANGERTDII